MQLNLIDWFKEFSYYTWSRLELSRRSKSIKTNEVTLTQNLIHNYYLLSRQFDLPIQIFEANNESINGNDIEFALETANGYVLFPTQAKIIKPNDKYDTISHKVNNKYQIDLLEQYGKGVKGIPLYLFYNVLNLGLENFENVKSFEEKASMEIQNYGCSVARLSFIKKFNSEGKWKTPSFWDIHPENGTPIHQLIKIVGGNLLQCPLFRNEMDFLKNINLRYYSEEEVINGFDGNNLAPRPRIGYIPTDDDQKKAIMRIGMNNYWPKYRVVISNNPDFNKFSIKILR